jgi:hypothetical protein
MSGDTYDGEWKNNVRSGQGRYFSVEYSLLYEGEFRDGLPAILPAELRCFDFIGDETPEPKPATPPEPKKGEEPPPPPPPPPDLGPWKPSPDPACYQSCEAGQSLIPMKIGLVSEDSIPAENESGRWVLVELKLDALAAPDPSSKGKPGPGFGNTNTEPVPFELIDEVGALAEDVSVGPLKPSVDPAYARKEEEAPTDGTNADQAAARKAKYPPTYVVPRKMERGQTEVKGLALPPDLPEGNYTLSIRDGSGCPFLKEGEEIRPVEVKLTCTKGWKWKDGKPIDPAADTGKKK